MDDKVVIHVESNCYEVSKSKLTERSSYFNSMFNGDFLEKKESTINIKGIGCNSWERILYFIDHEKMQPDIYSIELYKELLDLLEASAMLQFIDIQECCTQMLYDMLHVGNALEILEVASKLDLAILIQKARAIVLWNADVVTNSDPYFRLNADQVEGCLSDPALHSESGEWGVWEALNRWINSPTNFQDSRAKFLPRLIKCIHLEGLSVSDLQIISLNDVARSSKTVSAAINILIEEKLNKKKEDAAEVEKIIISNDSGKINNDHEKEEVQAFIEEWKKTSRKLPLVPAIIAKVIRGPDVIRPYVVRFSEDEKKFIPVIRLDEVETSLGALVGFKVIAHGSKLYMLGGEILTRQSSWYHAIWQYDMILGRWLFLANLRREGRHLSACVIDDDLYVIGGFGRHRLIQDTVSKLSISDRLWTTCAPLPRPMYSVPCCVFKGNIYVIQTFVYQYSPQRDSWISIDVALPADKVFCDAVVNSDNIFLSGRSRTIYKFNPSLTGTKVEEVGNFKYECSQICLIDDYIYSMSQDEFGEEIYCEKMNIGTGESIVMWEGMTGNEIANLGPNQHHGCFPLLLY